MNLDEFKKAWESIDLIKVFEIEVKNNRLESDYVVFDIDIRGNNFIASHEPLTREQDQSKYIPFISYPIDADFSIDEHLEDLHELCINAIIDSDFFILA